MSNGRIEPSYLGKLQENVANIRNFCILAHVDHGKTTLSDSLVCSNGVISPKLAGKIRFLDSTEEEQRRGITMHSSAIALLYRMEDKSGAKPDKSSDVVPCEEYLINLVDSPGHIDFSSDVSTATRLCDGALIVIDVLEGMCTQTHAVIYKALRERMKPCLVLNKLDRLALEMKFTPIEAFHHLRRILENVNALAFTLLVSELRLIAELEGKDPNLEINEDDPFVQEWNFSPEKGNVIFASAIDSWGFSITKFSNIWAKKLGVNKNVLQKYFFEDYSFNMKTMKIAKYDALESSSMPMFAAMILEPIWKLYDVAITNEDPEKAVKIAMCQMNVEVPTREINTRDPRLTVQAIFRRWLPLPDALLRMIVRVLPNPIQAQQIRINSLLSNPSGISSSLHPDKISTIMTMNKVYEEVQSCNIAADADVTLFISKMTPIRAGDLSSADLAMLRAKRQALAVVIATTASDCNDSAVVPPVEVIDSSTEVFMGLGRVFSGVLSRDKDLYILGSRHDPMLLDEDDKASSHLSNHNNSSNNQSVKKLAAGSYGIYICLGPSAYPVDKAYAGNIIGIIGLEEHVFKTGTLCSTYMTSPMKAITFQAKPMVKVAVEPVSHLDLPKLAKGLESLYQYDPVVEVGIDDSGQYTMTCLGELHLELCLKTLIDKFAKCEVKASEPLVSFRETVLAIEGGSSGGSDHMQSPIHWLPPPWKDTPLLETSLHGRCRLQVSSNHLTITFRCFPLPSAMASILEEDNQQVLNLSEWLQSSSNRASNTLVQGLWTKIQHAMTEESAPIDRVLQPSSSSFDVLHRMISIGPKSIGPNLLVFDPDVEIMIHSSTIPRRQPGNHSHTPSYSTSADELSASSAILSHISLANEHDAELFQKLWNRIQGSVVTGFQVATSSGPIMNEPLYGVGYAIEEVSYSYATIASDLSVEDRLRVHPTSSGSTHDHDNDSSSSNMIMTGQLISEVRDTLRLCMLSCPKRVVEPIYACELQCDQAQLGNLYSVLSKRRGFVTKEDIIDGTSLFLLSANLPVMESFSFTQELLNKTSGIGTAPQLRFSHWAHMEVDPFWRAKTEEELEEFGNQNNELNKVRILVDKTRKRKGLPIEEKVVVFGEKQRTLRK